MYGHPIAFLLTATIPIWLLPKHWYWIGAACTLFALGMGWLEPLGIVWLVLFATLAWQYRTHELAQPWLVIPVAMASIALIGHLLPGLNSPIVIPSGQISVDAVPYTK